MSLSCSSLRLAVPKAATSHSSAKQDSDAANVEDGLSAAADTTNSFPRERDPFSKRTKYHAADLDPEALKVDGV
jgi:hypothetical protein